MCHANHSSTHDGSSESRDHIIQDNAAVIAAKERHAAAWTKAFASVLRRGYVTGHTVENPHTISLADLEECAEPAVYLQLDRFVRDAGTRRVFDYPELGAATACAVRMADNLVDTFARFNRGAGMHRRIAVGVKGMFKALSALGYRPCDKAAWSTASRIVEELRLAAYRTSIALAAEKGAYAAFDLDAVSGSPEFRLLPEEVRNDIRHFGLRNAALFRQPFLGKSE